MYTVGVRTGLFLFHRDLRLDDNLGLLRACAECEQVIPCFIVDPAQANPRSNPYRGEHAAQFLASALLSLQQDIAAEGGELQIIAGDTATVIRDLLRKKSCDAVYANRDYTPFAHRRDGMIAEECSRAGIAFVATDDALLQRPEDVLKADGTPYTVFTPFWRKHTSLSVRRATPFTGRLAAKKLPHCSFDLRALFHLEVSPDARRGRAAALNILRHLDAQKRYAEFRDFPALDATTHLSAHLKFGTCSVREAYHAIALALGDDHPLLRQLVWRDFFTHIGFHFPRVFGKPFHAAYDHLAWAENDAAFARWAEGMTGFPIVDAGMRELRTTGFMHNRVRMITASFLVKDLLIDWRKGERHFARYLADYDPCVNNGNWQWAASTGCDAVPYFRIFNPWVQQKKFDVECVYIKRHIPELADAPPALIHRWYDARPDNHGYPQPMLDHAQAAAAARNLFANT